MKEKTLGIITSPGYGMRDYHKPILFFTIYTSEASASLQVFEQPEADSIIQAYGVFDVHDLKGKPCWVEDNGPGRIMKFIGPCLIKL